MKKLCLGLFLITFFLNGNIVLSEEAFIQVVTEDWKPYSYREDGVVKGTATEIVRATLVRAGLNYNIKVYPWARAYHMSLNNENILIFAITKTDERLPLFKWVSPVSPGDNNYFYKLKTRKDIIINSLEEAKKYSVGANRASYKHQLLIKHKFPKIHPNVHMKYSIKQLFFSRIDLVLSDSQSMIADMKEIGKPLDQIEEAFLVYTNYNYMAFSLRTSDAIVKRVKKAYNLLVEEGKISRFD